MPNSNTNDRFYDALSIACGLAIFTRNQFLGACRRTPSPLCVGLATILSQMWGVEGISIYRNYSLDDRVGGKTFYAQSPTTGRRLELNMGNLHVNSLSSYRMSYERKVDFANKIDKHNQYVLREGKRIEESGNFNDIYQRQTISQGLINLYSEEQKFFNETRFQANEYSIEYMRGFSEGDNNGFGRGILEGFETGKARGLSEGNSTGFAAGNETGFAAGNFSGYAAGDSDGYERGRRDYEHDDTPMFTIIMILSAALAFSITFNIISNVRQCIRNKRHGNRTEEGRSTDKELPSAFIALLDKPAESDRATEIPSSRLVPADVGKAGNEAGYSTGHA